MLAPAPIYTCSLSARSTLDLISKWISHVNYSAHGSLLTQGPQRPCSREAARDSFVPYSFLLLRSEATPIHRIYCCCGPFAFAITVLIDFLITQSSGITFKGPLQYLTLSGILLLSKLRQPTVYRAAGKLCLYCGKRV